MTIVTSDSISDTFESGPINPRKQEFLRVFRQINMDMKGFPDKDNTKSFIKPEMKVKIKHLTQDSNSAHSVEKFSPSIYK